MNSTQPRTGFASKIRFTDTGAAKSTDAKRGFASKIRFASGSALARMDAGPTTFTEEEFQQLLRLRQEAQQKQLLASRQSAYSAMTRHQERVTRLRAKYGIRV